MGPGPSRTSVESAVPEVADPPRSGAAGEAQTRPARRWSRKASTLGVVLLLVGFGLVTVDVLLGGPLRAADHQVDRWVVEYVPDPVVMLFRRWLVVPGQRAFDVPPMAVAAAVLAWRRRQWRPLLVPLVVMVFLALLVPGLKLWTGRTNPISGGDHLWSRGTEYPSGHEINAIVVWGMCFAMAARLDWPVGRWLTRTRQVLLTSAVAVWVGCGVMVARTHWFSDVVASLCLGIPLLWAVLRLGFVREAAGPARRPTPAGAGRWDSARSP